MLMDTNIPRVLDLRKCRLCFEEENRLIYIYEVSGCLKNVAKAITDVLNYEISIEDQFPPFICICCCGKLLEFRAFKVKCDSLRERFKLLLKSRKDAANSIQEKVEIEEESLDKDEQMFDTKVIEENSAFDKYQLEIGEGIPEKDEQMFDTNVIEENSSFGKSQVVQNPQGIEEKEIEVPIGVEVVQNPQRNAEKEIEVPIGVEEQDRALRCRKAVNYNVDQSGSEASDPESSDSFCPSNQGDTDGVSSDDSLGSDRNQRKKKRSQVCRENAGLATARNNPDSGAAGLEEVADGGSGQIGCDPGTVKGRTGESSAVSPISSGNNGYTRSIVRGVSQMGPWVGLTSSNASETHSVTNAAGRDAGSGKKTNDRVPYLLRSTSTYVPVLCNLIYEQEMPISSEQSLATRLLDLTVQKNPWEILVLGNLLLQPEMRRNSLSARHLYDLLNLPRIISASPNPVSQLEARRKISDKEKDDGSSDSLSSAADAIDDIEDDFDGENPVTKKTKEYLCDVCGSVFYNSMALYNHRKGVHGEKRFKCSKCPKAFTLKHHLQQHMSMHDDSRPFVCKECGSRFKLKTHLRQHVVVHSKKAMFQCSHCDKGFHTKWQHDNHQPSHEGKVVWSCDGCTEKLTTWAAYLDHLLEHKKNRTFKCDMCSKVYNIKNDLKKHVMSHIKPFECTVCGKRLGRNRTLQSHMRIHTGEWPYVCNVCGKGFSSNAVLKSHLIIHSDVRPFKCRFCDHRAKLKASLKDHELRVHKKCILGIKAKT